MLNSNIEPMSLEESIGKVSPLPPDSQSVFSILKKRKCLLIQARSGVPTVEGMRSLLAALSHSDICTLTIDSYTRLLLLDKANPLNDLNGFPLLSHTLEACQSLVRDCRRPLQVRHGSPDPRMLALRSFACGITSFEGGGISYNLPYAKNVSLSNSLRFWAEADRLAAAVGAHWGIPIDRETFGTLSAVLTPPSLSIAINSLEALLAAEMGVKCITLGLPETGVLYQDIASIRASRIFTKRVLHDDSIHLFISFHQWMGVFPSEPGLAWHTIGAGILAAFIGDADKVIVKTPLESLQVPTEGVNAKSVSYCKELLTYCSENQIAGYFLQDSLLSEQIDEETDRLLNEAEAILSNVLSISDCQTLSQKIVRAFEIGILDIPFPASRYARGDVIPCRSSDGAVRYMNAGRLGVASESALSKDQRNMPDRLLADINAMATGEIQSGDQARGQILAAFHSKTAKSTHQRSFSFQFRTDVKDFN